MGGMRSISLVVVLCSCTRENPAFGAEVPSDTTTDGSKTTSASETSLGPTSGPKDTDPGTSSETSDTTTTTTTATTTDDTSSQDEGSSTGDEGTSSGGTTLGCTVLEGCSPGEYCAFEMGCGSNGVCQPRPRQCPFGGTPVTGCDCNRIYENECWARRAGFDVACEGKVLCC
jgi:hypothetical protein